MIVKKRQTLAFKIGMVVLASLLVILGSCGVLTYFNQISVYRQQCEASLRDAGEYLEKRITEDGEEFARYQAYFLEHYTEVDIPADAQNYVPYRTAFERLFHTTYPGKTLGVDIEFDELSEEVKQAWLVYRQVFWLKTFEDIRSSYGLAYIYYILPDAVTESDIYIIDGTMPTRADHIQLMAEYPEEYPAKFDHPQGEEAAYLYLGDQVPNARAEYDVKWKVWDSGEKQTGFQIWDNEYGKTYGYYTPVVVNGQKLG